MPLMKPAIPKQLHYQRNNIFCNLLRFFYANEFKQSGFRGPLSYYRNMDLTWQLTKDSPRQISQPALFVAGERDGVILMAADALKELDKHVTDLRVNKLIPKIGHWTQQEAPDEVNQALIQFLEEIG